jgi:hypothetical protein
MPRAKQNVLDRLMSRCNLDSNGCLVWQGATDKDGYGIFKVDGRVVKTHRWNFEHVNGPLPDHLVVDHVCRNRACANVGHLRAATRRENTMAEGSEAIPAKQARKTHCRRGHQLGGENAVKTSRACRSCRAAVSMSQRSHDRQGEKWSETQIREYADLKFKEYAR